MTVSVRDIHLEVDELLEAQPRVLDLVCGERLFEVGTCRVRAVVEHPPEGDRLLGVDAAVRLETARGERAWHGIVTAVGVTPRHRGDFVLRLDIRAPFALLELGCDSRSFQRQTVQQIVDEVFTRARMPAGSWSWSLTEPLRPQRNVHQYAESDLDFVRRLLAEEGLSFFIENDASGARLVLFDSLGAARPIPGEVLDCIADGVDTRDGLYELEETHRVTVASLVLQDVDLAQPRDLDRMRGTAVRGAGPQVYLHPAGFDGGEPEVSRARRAARALEGMRRDRCLLHGRSGVASLEPGRTALVQGHERVALNQSLLCVAVEHRARRDEIGVCSYENELVAVPADVVPRPERGRSGPRVVGLQPALVTAPSGLEHLSEEHGRVRVRFRWDRSASDDATSSTWCRVGQPQLPRPQVIPRAGFEVDVDFEHGDGDRPTVVGHRYNDERGLPYPLPAHAAQSAWQSATLSMGPLSNELRFDDTRGAEEVYLHASMIARTVVERAAVRRIAREERVQVGVRNALTVSQSFTAAVQQDHRLSVGRNIGRWVGRNLADAIEGQSRVASARRRLETGGDLTEEVRGNLTRTIGPVQAVCGLASVQHRTLGASTTRVGTVSIEAVAGRRMLSVRGDLTEEVADTKLVEAGAFRSVVRSGYDNRFAQLDLAAEADRTDHAERDARLAAQGELTVSAEHISVSGSEQLSLSAGSCEIVLRSSGEVTLRAPRVNLRNAQAIRSVVEVN